jgi:hypothetical protein
MYVLGPPTPTHPTSARLVHGLQLNRDFADDHPEATVIGTDISPIQPKWVPPNLKL